MNIRHFLDDIRSNCSELTYMCVNHILEKQFDVHKDTLHEDDVMDIFANYGNFQKYLNDYAGVIYRKYTSSIEEVYSEVCEYLNLDDNNQYIFEFDLEKLEKQTPIKIMQIKDDELKLLTVEKQESRLKRLIESKFYTDNIDKYKERIVRLESNFTLVKKALNTSADY